jgi:uncharacterized protein DUF3352
VKVDQDAGANPGGEPSPASGRPAFIRPKLRWIVLTLAAVLALGAVAVAAALFLTRPSQSIDSMVPANAHLYVVVYIDPPLGQKANLSALIQKIPDLKNQDIGERVDEALNHGFKDPGLSFDGDIRPWLGSRLAVAARAGAEGDAQVLLVQSRDDGKARAALAKLRATARGRTYQWKDESYAGVTISIGTPPSGSSTSKDALYAYVDHTVVIGDSEAFIRSVIDADQGRGPRLVDSANYKAMLSRLPSERLVFLYINGGPANDRLKVKVTGKNLGVPVPEESPKFDALTSLGFVLVARANGLAADLEVKLDASKLDTATRSLLLGRSHRNATLDWVPRGAYLLYATTASSQGLQQAITQASASHRDVGQVLDRLGLTGPKGALAHLTGDDALEVEGGASVPAGALLLRTDNPASLQSFLDNYFLYGLQVSFQTKCHVPLSRAPATCTSEPTVSSATSPRGTLRRETYQGVVITTLMATQPTPQAISPAYAIADGMGIIASSIAEVKAVIDTHQTHQTIATAEHYLAASRDLNASPDTTFYLDIGAAVRSIRPLLPPSIQRVYDSKVGPDLAPLKAFIVTGQTGSDSLSDRIFILFD